MEAKSIGATIAALRKKNEMTQAALAARLNVSDKTVSKWESGLGFPEIIQFPALAALFHVSVDYLMMGERKGIVVAGNMLTDLVKTVDCFPKQGMLANISSVSRAVGGCAPNTAIDLAVIDNSLPIHVIGRVGDDEYGRFLLTKLQQYGIHTDKIRVSSTATTGFCDVMNLPSGERTFFHAMGANGEFCPQDIDLATLSCSMLHIGYVLLLNQFDAPDDTYGTVMARFLHDVREMGIKTSIDAVSNSSADYRAKLLPPLKYTDYVIMNEIECCGIWGLASHDENGPIIENIREAMQRMMAHGVHEKVVIHCKEAGFCLDRFGQFSMVPSIDLPKEEIKGKVGAGDAFCAGCLYGIYNGFTDEKMLEFAASAAACNLFSENSIDGMRSKKEILKISERYGRMKL